MRILIVIILLAGTLSCDAWERTKLKIQRSACTEDRRFISADSLEAIKHRDGSREINRFRYGGAITGDYHHDLVQSYQGGRKQMSMALSITNTGYEDIYLELRMELQGENSTYTPNLNRTCNSSECPVYAQGGTARVEIKGDSQEGVTYFFDLDLLEELKLDLIVEAGENGTTETLVNAELIQMILRSNCLFGGNNPRLSQVE